MTQSNNNIVNTLPKDGNVFIYMQILHVNKINTDEQTFDANFYMRATWVQDKNKNKNGQDDQMSYYRPRLSFDNAVDVINLDVEGHEVSSWRTPHNLDDGETTDQYAVIEWKARGNGTFKHSFELQNYPHDVQLLKITIGSLDNRIRLHDDHRDMVQSTIRKDYIQDLGFKFLAWEDIVHTRSSFSQGQQFNNGYKIVGGNLASEEENFVINPVNGRSFATLSYIVPVERSAKHVTKQVLCPITLISLSSFVPFLAFRPEQAYERVAVGIALAVVMTMYCCLTSSSVPKLERYTSFNRYILVSFCYLFLVLLSNTILAAAGNRMGYLRSTSDMNITTQGDEMDRSIQYSFGGIGFADVILHSVFFVFWFVWNTRQYNIIFHKTKQDAMESARSDLTNARDGAKYRNETTIGGVEQTGAFDSQNPRYRNRFLK